jgi:hypothetical protein
MDNPLLQLLIGSSAPPKPLPPNASYKLRYELWLRDNHKWLLPMLDTARVSGNNTRRDTGASQPCDAAFRGRSSCPWFLLLLTGAHVSVCV